MRLSAILLLCDASRDTYCFLEDACQNSRLSVIWLAFPNQAHTSLANFVHPISKFYQESDGISRIHQHRGQGKINGKSFGKDGFKKQPENAK